MNMERDNKFKDGIILAASPVKSFYRVSHERVFAFGGLWNEKYVTDIPNRDVNLSVKG